MAKYCYITVSNAALCQKCPALLAYMIHRGEKDAWKVGIRGNGHYYGTLFHKNIAQVFFEAASERASLFHGKIARSISGGAEAIESVIRGNIFMPFLEAHSEECTSGQIMAMSNGITVLSRAMSEFFALIPSLMRSPEENMRTVFIKPEQKLQAYYDCPEGKLLVAGRYDALLFNPDRAEARLFEFKGYTKSDVTVPLSQSLIYSWLVWKHTGIIPSVEIIYLDDVNRGPEIFEPSSVRDMIFAGLPGLFRAAFGVISLERLPEIVRDKNLCVQCPFRENCADDWRSLAVKKRRGASLLNVMVFMMFAVMIASQVFFFAKWSADSVAEERELMMYRLHLDSIVDEAKSALEIQTGTHEIKHKDVLDTKQLKFSDFSNDAVVFDNSKLGSEWQQDGYKDTYHVRIYDLDYMFDASDFDENDRNTWIGTYGNKNACYKVFAAMLPLGSKALDDEGNVILYPPINKPHYVEVYSRFYLIRAWANLPESYYGRKLMYQVLVKRDEADHSNLDTLSFQEVWF